jgi:3-hydroxyisobutyrate dehydrogenase
MAKVAFVGLGRMGQGMAARLLAAGHDLSVYNRTAAHAEPLARQGARVCVTPKDACEGAEAVISMVADDNASRSIWFEGDGILAANLRSNAFAIECSTLSYEWVMQLSAQATALSLRYIDAPVTGLPDSAATGSLTLLVGASEDDLDAARDTLSALCARIIRFGQIGTGTAYKLIINLIGAVQIASAAEGLAIAERAGLDVVAVADAIASSQAASPQVIRNTRRMAAADHQQNVVFTPTQRLKDIEYALRFAHTTGIGSPFGEVAERIYSQLCKRGYGEVNESKVIDVCRAYRGRSAYPY